MTADGVLAQLTSACEVTAASDADVVGGRQARYVAAPASTDEAAALLKAAAELGLAVVPRGSGSRLDWGGPPARCDLIVETRRLSQVLEHAAGDLVCQVQAGVHLDDLAAVLATASQRLALDPPGTPGTIGGLIATGRTGSLRYRFGSPRDLLIGITIVRADGTVARSGGKVVKNVAGYDLGKLFAGSYGTLGLITEATFRLHPLPQQSSWLTLDLPDAESAASAVQAMSDSPLAPAAIDLSWLSEAKPISVSVLLEGDEASVAERTSRMRRLLRRGTAGQLSAQHKRADNRLGHPAPAGVDTGNPPDADAAPQADDGGLAGAERAGGPFMVGRPPVGDRGPAGTLIRVAFWSGQLVPVLTAIRDSAREHGLDPAINGSAAAGVLEVELGEEARANALAGFVTALRQGLGGLTGPVEGMPPSVASAVVLHAPPSVRDGLDVWGPVPSLALMRAVKDQFDPEHRMAPGRLAGGM